MGTYGSSSTCALRDLCFGPTRLQIAGEVCRPGEPQDQRLLLARERLDVFVVGRVCIRVDDVPAAEREVLDRVTRDDLGVNRFVQHHAQYGQHVRYVLVAGVAALAPLTHGGALDACDGQIAQLRDQNVVDDLAAAVKRAGLC